MLAIGRTDGEIADALFISKKTASVHVANIKGKLGASSRVEIALIAERLGLVDGAGDGAGDGSSAWAVARAGRPVELCPFKGLAPFESADARFFFGRERLVADLVARMVGATCIAVVGPSGSGKSSAVRAGLLPAVAGGVLPGSETWSQALLRPGAAPMAALRRSLHDAAERQAIAVPDDATIAELRDRLTATTRLLVTIDQFEEAFTLCPVEAERSAFIDALVALAEDREARSVVVLAIRADFYGRCATYPGLARLLGEGTILVGPPTAEEIERAIEAPARAAGLRVEPQLTTDLVRDVTGEPGALPLLSTTLLDLWSRRDGKVLRAATYRQIGGVSGAVARLAEAAFGRLNDEQQEVARGVLLRLAATGEGNVVVRRPVPLCGARRRPRCERGKVLAVLADARLSRSVTGRSRSLTRRSCAIGRDSASGSSPIGEGRRLHDHLMHAAREWQRAGEDGGELLRGARLAATLDWAGGHDIELNSLERRFLAAAGRRRARDRPRAAHEPPAALAPDGDGRAPRRGARDRFIRARPARSGGVRGGRAASEAQRATDEARRAEAQATVARSRELTAATIATLGEDPSLSKLLGDLGGGAGTTGHRPGDGAPPSHRRGRDDRPICDPGRHADRRARDGPAPRRRADSSAAREPPGPGVTSSPSSTWHPTRSSGSTPPVDSSTVVGPAYFSPDGASVITAEHWVPDPAKEEPPPPPRRARRGRPGRSDRSGHRALRRPGVAAPSLHAVSRTTAIIEVVPEYEPAPTCFSDPDAAHELETIDLASGRRSLLATSWFGQGALSRDGRFAAFNDLADGDRARVVDLASGATVMSLERGGLPQRDQYVRALSADGSLLLYGDRPMMVYEVATGAAIATLEGDEGEHFFAEFGPEGPVAYISGRDGTLRVWDAAVGSLLFEAARRRQWPAVRHSRRARAHR